MKDREIINLISLKSIYYFLDYFKQNYISDLLVNHISTIGLSNVTILILVKFFLTNMIVMVSKTYRFDPYGFILLKILSKIITILFSNFIFLFLM